MNDEKSELAHSSEIPDIILNKGVRDSDALAEATHTNG